MGKIHPTTLETKNGKKYTQQPLKRRWNGQIDIVPSIRLKWVIWRPFGFCKAVEMMCTILKQNQMQVL